MLNTIYIHMIRLKLLLENTKTSLTPKVIYNFYALWYANLHNHEQANSDFGRDVITHYLQNYKKIYVELFSQILRTQIAKYIRRARIDQDFSTNLDVNTLSPSQLKQFMAKTFRSDMKRRNDVWNLIADYTDQLSLANDNKTIFLMIDRLNNAVHNTNTSVLDKLSNYKTELQKALDNCHNLTNIKYLQSFVDKDIRELL